MNTEKNYKSFGKKGKTFNSKTDQTTSSKPCQKFKNDNPFLSAQEPDSDKPYIIGLTGGIGSGKSVAAQIFAALGAYIIDTDEVAKAVMAAGTECDLSLKAAFPSCVADGILQRALLKAYVFKNEEARKLLNSITHPHIITETMRRARQAGTDDIFLQQNEKQATDACQKGNAAIIPCQKSGQNKTIPLANDQKSGQKIVVIQVPLLFESGFDRLCNATVCVTCPTDIRIKRVAQRDNISAELIKAIMSTQLSDKELIQKCDYAIANNGDIKELAKNIEEVFCKIKQSV